MRTISRSRGLGCPGSWEAGPAGLLVVRGKVLLVSLHLGSRKWPDGRQSHPRENWLWKKTANFHVAAVKSGSTASLFVAQNAAVVYRKASSQRPTDEYVLHRHS